MKTYFSIRVVSANSKEEALEKILSEEFNEDHPLCDKILDSSRVQVDGLYQ